MIGDRYIRCDKKTDINKSKRNASDSLSEILPQKISL